jgi:hypothetical protein
MKEMSMSEVMGQMKKMILQMTYNSEAAFKADNSESASLHRERLRELRDEMESHKDGWFNVRSNFEGATQQVLLAKEAAQLELQQQRRANDWEQGKAKAEAKAALQVSGPTPRSAANKAKTAPAKEIKVAQGPAPRPPPPQGGCGDRQGNCRVRLGPPQAGTDTQGRAAISSSDGFEVVNHGRKKPPSTGKQGGNNNKGKGDRGGKGSGKEGQKGGGGKGRGKSGGGKKGGGKGRGKGRQGLQS